jgi:hypothetical protein
MNLTPQQEQFCRAFVADGNAEAAFCDAYPVTKPQNGDPIDAEQLLDQPEVAARIAELERCKQRDLGLSPVWVLAHLKKEIEDHGGGSSQSARVTALNLMMRHFDMYTAVPPHPDKPTFDLSKLTDAQKRAILDGLQLALVPQPTGAGPAPSSSDVPS